MTKLSEDKEAATFYAGAALIELHRTETTNYRDNLASGSPGLWVVLRQTGVSHLTGVHGDGRSGGRRSHDGAGNDLVDQVAMPAPIRAAIEAFVAEHHVEREFIKRKRDRADPEALAYRAGKREDLE